MRKLLHTLCCGAIGLVMANGAIAQTAPQPPVAQNFDGNGINQATGLFDLPGLEINIGGKDSGLQRVIAGTGYSYAPADNFSDSIRISSVARSGSGGSVFADVSFDGTTHHFYVGSYNNYPQNQNFFNIPAQEEGGTARLRCSDTFLRSTTGSCTLVLGDGTKIVYERSLSQPDPSPLGAGNAAKFVGYGTVITRPNGEIVTLSYTSTVGQAPTLISATSNLGWMLKFHSASYQVYDLITGINLSGTYCNPAALSCTVPSNYPYVTASTGGNTTTLYRNGVLEQSYTKTADINDIFAQGTVTINTPSGISKTVIKGPYTSSGVPYNYYSWPLTVTRGGRTWQYSYAQGLGTDSNSGGFAKLTGQIKNPDNSIRSLETNRTGKIKLITDELNRKTIYTYGNEFAENAPSDLVQLTPPEGASNGGYSSYTYDSSGRLRTVTNKAKPGFGLADQVTTVEYIACDNTNDFTCNKPLWIRDANNNQTDYTYSPDHGGILTETGPADATGVRPQTRYSYTQLYPKILNASGVLVNSTPVWRLTRTSTCRVATAANPAACVTTPPSADETVTEYEYANNNLLLTKVTVRAGNANVAVTASPSNVWQSTSYDYDVVGNQIMVDGPLPGTVDRSYTVYDALRRPVYEIGVDPDGAGTLPSVAIHHMYDVDGREYRTETGRGNGTNMRTCVPTAATCTYFAVTSYVQRTYDPTTGLEVKSITAQP